MNPHHINNPHFEQLPPNYTYMQPPYYPPVNTMPDVHSHICNHHQSNIQSNLPTMPIMPRHPPPQYEYYGTLPPPPITYPVDSLATSSLLVQCIHCKNSVMTELNYDIGLMTGVSAACLCVVGITHGGCLIPCLIPWTKDVTHTCPSCRQKIATYKRLEMETEVHTA